MKLLAVRNLSRGRLLGEHVRLADGWWSRLRGLLGRPAPRPGEGLLLSPCTAVHMYGMKYPLDVLFLDRAGRVLCLYPELRPGERTARHRNARHALELPAGTLARTGTRPGDTLAWAPAAPPTPSNPEAR